MFCQAGFVDLLLPCAFCSLPVLGVSPCLLGQLTPCPYFCFPLRTASSLVLFLHMLSFSFLLLTSTSLSVFAAAFHCCNSPFHPAQLLALHCAWPCTGCASRTSAFTHSTDPPFHCALPADVSACTSWLQSLFSRHPSIFSPTCSLHGAPCCFLIAGVQPPCSLPPSSCRWTCSLLLSAASLPSAQRNLPTHMGSLLVVAYTDLLLPGACCGFFCTVTTFILHPQFSILLLLQ